MAGDWLKMEVALPEKPEVWQIAGMTGIDPDAVVGKLLKVWRWFDAHTEEGNAVGVTYALVDHVTSVTGFGEAMALCGWLFQDGSTLRCPNFDRHNGKTAKDRALTAKRVAKSKVKSNGASVTSPLPNALPREEKRIEEEKHIGAAAPAPKKPTKRRQTEIPEGFAISERVKRWAAEKGHTRLEERFEHFVGVSRRKGYTYADWDEAFMAAVRENWAKFPTAVAQQEGGGRINLGARP